MWKITTRVRADVLHWKMLECFKVVRVLGAILNADNTTMHWFHLNNECFCSIKYQHVFPTTYLNQSFPGSARDPALLQSSYHEQHVQEWVVNFEILCDEMH